jgi:hypothetical protein
MILQGNLVSMFPGTRMDLAARPYRSSIVPVLAVLFGATCHDLAPCLF